MTAVLPPTDILRRDRMTPALDDSKINYSNVPIDWRSRYNEAADMLAETRAELDEFQVSSKELEEELVNELERTEKVQQDLKLKIGKAEIERDDWKFHKSKYMSLQTTHNTTTTSLQRELDQLRQEHQKTKIQLRELEMGNDDLERNERAVTSSLADVEAKYSRALEEKILLEHELLDKANLEEETQRLKDELRDANVEVSILKDQLRNQANASPVRSSSETLLSISPHFPQTPVSSEDDHAMPPTPTDMHLSDLSSELGSESLTSEANTTPRHIDGQSVILRRAGFPPIKSSLTPPNASPKSLLGRSTTVPSLMNSRMPPPRTPPRQVNYRNFSTTSTSTATSTASKSKGVQMVSEMRQRVRNLEQKIHTRVPRLRIGSVTTRGNAISISNMVSSPASTKAPSTKSARSNVSEDRILRERDSNEAKRTAVVSNQRATPVADRSGTGWVLIMEDSPSPVKDKDKERRRISSPPGPSSFRPVLSPSLSESILGPLELNPKAIVRPQSRLSGSGTTATASGSPYSRPTTPTFLPLPTASFYAHPSTAGITGLKKSVAGAPNQVKRSSLGSSAASPLFGADNTRNRPTTMPARPASGTPSTGTSKHDRFSEVAKALPKVAGLNQNVITTAPPTKLPTSASSALLSQSRIGRLTSGRRSAEVDDGLQPAADYEKGRMRAGSANALRRFGR